MRSLVSNQLLKFIDPLRETSARYFWMALIVWDGGAEKGGVVQVIKALGYREECAQLVVH
ncbi:MAG TPA: hypothetical protein VJV03_00340 [Pyrinomonadaceae bacterium]|nr:hypothetical protein [Pyrinomonadaceae bacterium]